MTLKDFLQISFPFCYLTIIISLFFFSLMTFLIWINFRYHIDIDGGCWKVILINSLYQNLNVIVTCWKECSIIKGKFAESLHCFLSICFKWQNHINGKFEIFNCWTFMPVILNCEKVVYQLQMERFCDPDCSTGLQWCQLKLLIMFMT